MINEANKIYPIDFLVQSTDKNFLTPVGGAIVWSSKKENIKKLSENYPGRAGINSVLDLFLSLLGMGK